MSLSLFVKLDLPQRLSGSHPFSPFIIWAQVVMSAVWNWHVVSFGLANGAIFSGFKGSFTKQSPLT